VTLPPQFSLLEQACTVYAKGEYFKHEQVRFYAYPFYLYAFFWVIHFILHTYLPMKMEQTEWYAFSGLFTSYFDLLAYEDGTDGVF
jgi:hypothetical protein